MNLEGKNLFDDRLDILKEIAESYVDPIDVLRALENYVVKLNDF